jgi:hypothetical protein
MSRVSAQRLARLRAALPDRDRRIVTDIQRVRLLSARQIERLQFREGSALTQARRARRTLERLTQDGVLHRFDRRVGGVRAGSSSHVYGLSALGQRLAEGPGPAGGQRNRRPWEPSSQFMRHVMAVSELYPQLRETESSGALDLIEFDAEPAAWRWDDNSGVPNVKPDAYVSVGVERFEELRFIEVDLATESRAVIRRKAKAYVDYWESGAEQQTHGVVPSVLFLAETTERVDVLVKVLAELSADAWQLFQVGLLANAVALISGTDPEPIAGTSTNNERRRS